MSQRSGGRVGRDLHVTGQLTQAARRSMNDYFISQDKIIASTAPASIETGTQMAAVAST